RSRVEEVDGSGGLVGTAGWMNLGCIVSDSLISSLARFYVLVHVPGRIISSLLDVELGLSEKRSGAKEGRAADVLPSADGNVIQVHDLTSRPKRSGNKRSKESRDDRTPKATEGSGACRES